MSEIQSPKSSSPRSSLVHAASKGHGTTVDPKLQLAGAPPSGLPPVSTPFGFGPESDNPNFEIRLNTALPAAEVLNPNHIHLFRLGPVPDLDLEDNTAEDSQSIGLPSIRKPGAFLTQNLESDLVPEPELDSGTELYKHLKTLSDNNHFPSIRFIHLESTIFDCADSSSTIAVRGLGEKVPCMVVVPGEDLYFGSQYSESNGFGIFCIVDPCDVYSKGKLFHADPRLIHELRLKPAVVAEGTLFAANVVKPDELIEKPPTALFPTTVRNSARLGSAADSSAPEVRLKLLREEVLSSQIDPQDKFINWTKNNLERVETMLSDLALLSQAHQLSPEGTSVQIRNARDAMTGLHNKMLKHISDVNNPDYVEKENLERTLESNAELIGAHRKHANELILLAVAAVARAPKIKEPHRDSD